MANPWQNGGGRARRQARPTRTRKNGRVSSVSEGQRLVADVRVPTILNVASLRDFIVNRRDEIRDLCVRKIRAEWPDRPGTALEADLAALIDEIARALGREQGLPETSPLPGGKSETAARHGRRRQELGYTIQIITRDFG